MSLFRGGEKIPFGIFYTKDGVGVPGLEDVTIDIWRRDIAAGSKSEVVTAGACSEVGDGVYDYIYTTEAGYYVYWAIGKTGGDVDQKYTAAYALTDTQAQTDIALLVNRIGAFTGTGVNTVLGFLKALASKVATLPSDIGGTFSPATDSLEALQEGTVSGVWSYTTRTLTQSAAQVTAAVEGSELNILRGDTWTASLTGLGSIADREKLWFTVKYREGEADAKAIIQIEETKGLLYLNRAEPTETMAGSITVDDEDAGDITITLNPEATAMLEGRDGLRYDVQKLTSEDAVQTMTEGVCNIKVDVTRAIS